MCHNVAHELIKAKLLESKVIFSEFTGNGYWDFEDMNGISVRSPSNMMLALREFGHWIRNLEIKTVSNSDATMRLSEIVDLLEKHSSETLEELHISDIDQNLFKNVKTTFGKVEIISLAGKIGGLGNEQFYFNEIFPALRELYIDNVFIRDSNNLTFEMPQLECLHSINFNLLNKERESVIEEMFRMNPQIRRLTLTDVDPNVVQAAADNLLNLEHFELSHYNKNDDEDHSFHFEDMKTFKIDIQLDGIMPRHITFGQKLEEFEVQFINRNPNVFNVIESHRNLKKLHLHGYLTNDEVLRLAAAELDVNEMTFYTNYDVALESTVQAIQSCKQLNKFHLEVIKRDRHFFGKLREQFESEWIIDIEKNISTDGRSVYFTKKK